MSRDGWLAIRNLPLPEDDIRDGNSYWKFLIRFFKKYRVCPKCGGDGFLYKRKLKTSKMEVIKYSGIKSLERIKERPNIIFSDFIKEIFLMQFAGKKPCPKCHASRFILREGKDNG